MDYQAKKQIIQNDRILKYLWYSVIVINCISLLGGIYSLFPVYLAQPFLFAFGTLVDPQLGLLILLFLIVLPLQIIILIGIFRLWKWIKFMLIVFILLSFTVVGGFPNYIINSIFNIIQNTSDTNFLRLILQNLSNPIDLLLSLFTIIAYWKIINRLQNPIKT